MSKIELQDIGTGFNLQTIVNNNNDFLEDAFDNTLSRDGSAPNGMEASLDMNSNRILNLGAPQGPNEAARLVDVLEGIEITGVVAPSQSGHADEALHTDGSTLSWRPTRAYYEATSDETSASAVIVDPFTKPGNVLRYGENTVPGTTDMTVAFQTAGLVTLNPTAPSGVYKVSGSTPIIANQHWTLEGTQITITGNTQVFTVAAGVNDWSIKGDWSVTGDNGAAGATSGTGAALKIIDSMRFRVEGLTAKNIKGWGILVQPGTSTASRAEKGQIVAPQCYACYVGIEAQAGGGAEYVNIVAPNVSRCNTGVRVAAGNLNVIGGSITDNTDGIDVVNGTNHAHGSFVGTYINHNTQYAVKATSVTFGHNLIGCHIYEGDIYLKSSQGVLFKSCTIDADNYYFEGSQGCGFIDCALPHAYSNTLNNSFNASPSYTIWQNCKRLTGKNTGPASMAGTNANIKGILVGAASPGLTYTPANLTAEQTVLLTDSLNASANDLSQTLFDGYVAGTGIFTCHGLGDGKVRVEADFNVSSNVADNTDNVYMYIQRNGSGVKHYLMRTKLTTTKTWFSFHGDIDLVDTDTLRFKIGQTSGIVNNVSIDATETSVTVEGL